MKSTMKVAIYGIPAMSLAAAMMVSNVKPASGEESKDTLGIPGEFSANVAIVTDYRFRGITQSDNDPAIQGGLDYSVGLSDDIGLYLGVWASSVNFNDGDEASIELDYYGGVTLDLSGVGVDLGLIYYTYPTASSGLNYDYVEGKIELSYSPIESVGLGIGYNYSPDYFGSSGNFHYPHASAEYTPDLGLPLPITFDATIGYSFIDDEAAFGARDYLDWTAGIGTEYKGINLKLQYVDNDLSGSLGDATVVFTAGASF